jgi:hypothetical protein
MKRFVTLLMMSLVLIFGLWGYSLSMDSPFPHTSPDATPNGGPDDDHPWGGDGGHNVGTTNNGVTVITSRPFIKTGNVVMDFVMNNISYHPRVLHLIYGSKVQTPITGSTATPNAPAGGNSKTSAN